MHLVLGQFSDTIHRIPKVGPKTLIAPYISSTARGARIQPSYLVNEADRKLSSGVRTVEDPIETKAKAAQVRIHILLILGKEYLL